MDRVNILSTCGFVLIFGIIIAIVNKIPGIASPLVSLSFVYVAILYIRDIFKGRIPYLYNYVIALSLILVFLNVSIVGGSDFSYYKKAIMYVATLLLMTSSTCNHISRKTVCCAIIINIVIGVVYLLHFSNGFTTQDDGQSLLTLNFSNSNQSGSFLLNTLLYIVLSFFMLDTTVKKWRILVKIVVLLSLIISLVILLYLTGCRSAIMSFVLFLVCIVLDLLLGDKVRLKRWMSIFIAVSPFIFVFIYLTYANSLSFDVSFGIEDSGKSIGTRIRIWKPIVDDFWHYFIHGDYYKISKGTGFSQMHNTHLDIYASYGIIVLVLYIGLLSSVLWKTYSQTVIRFQRISLYAFISTIFLGYFEAGFVSGSSGLFILTCGFLLLANSLPDEDTSGKRCRECR